MAGSIGPDHVHELVTVKEPAISPDGSSVVFTRGWIEKDSLEFKGWETTDAYSNNVSFVISNLKTNNQIVDDFFRIPKEEDL